MRVEEGRVEGRVAEACLDWSVVQASKSEEGPNGDGYLLKRNEDCVLFAVADGVGSGRAARNAAAICLETLVACPRGDLTQKFERCHAALAGTRGAALALLKIDLLDAHLTWAAVGDIDGCVFRGQIRRSVASLVQRGGTLGHHYVGFHAQDHRLQHGDMIAICSDGISRRYRDEPPAGVRGTEFAAACLEKFGRRNDDRTFAALSLKGTVS